MFFNAPVQSLWEFRTSNSAELSIDSILLIPTQNYIYITE